MLIIQDYRITYEFNLKTFSKWSFTSLKTFHSSSTFSWPSSLFTALQKIYRSFPENTPPFFKQNQNIFAFHFSVNNSIHYYSLQCCLLVVVNIILYYTHHKDLASNIWSTTIKEIHQRKLQIFQSCRQYYQFLMIKTTAVFLVLLCAALECSI